MHELSLAEGIVELVQAAAQREGLACVRVLRLSVGALAGVEVQALRFALQAIVPGTVLHDARIEIDEPRGRAWCAACACEVGIASRADPCAQCGAFGLRVVAGTELRVVDMVGDALPASTPASSGSATVGR